MLERSQADAIEYHILSDNETTDYYSKKSWYPVERDDIIVGDGFEHKGSKTKHPLAEMITDIYDPPSNRAPKEYYYGAQGYLNFSGFLQYLFPHIINSADLTKKEKDFALSCTNPDDKKLRRFNMSTDCATYHLFVYHSSKQ